MTDRPERGWREITDEDVIQELMTVFGNFHEGCIREIHIATGHSVAQDLSMHCDWRMTVHMLVQRQRRDPSAIEMRFEEVADFRLSPPPRDFVSVIFQAAFVLHEGVFYWSEDGNWSLGARQGVPVIAARKVWWRDASEWMGAELRYRVGGELKC